MTRQRVFHKHGYTAYTHGCRCDACRKAKADYMRARRARGRADAHRHAEFEGGRYVAPIGTHGTRAGYEEHGCRCAECSTARATSDARYYRGRVQQ